MLVEFTWYLHMTLQKSYRWSGTYIVSGHLQPIPGIWMLVSGIWMLLYALPRHLQQAHGVCMIVAHDLAHMPYQGICNHKFDSGQLVIQYFAFLFCIHMDDGGRLGGMMWGWVWYRNVNSLRHSVTFLWLWTMSTLGQIVLCHLFDTKPSSKPMFIYGQLDPWE